MSKKIDMSDLTKLSQDELKYLAERGHITPEERHQLIDGYTGEGHTFDRFGDLKSQIPSTPETNITSTSTNSVGGDEGDEGDNGSGEDSDTEEVTEYDDLSNEELKAELDERNVEYPSRANKKDLVKLLVENDEEDDEDDEEE